MQMTVTDYGLEVDTYIQWQWKRTFVPCFHIIDCMDDLGECLIAFVGLQINTRFLQTNGRLHQNPRSDCWTSRTNGFAKILHIGIASAGIYCLPNI